MFDPKEPAQSNNLTIMKDAFKKLHQLLKGEQNDEKPIIIEKSRSKEFQY